MMMCQCEPVSAFTSDTYDAVRERMEVLMPGWFDKQDELMLPDDLFHIRLVAEMVAKTGKSIDDAIHEYFKDDWFAYHDDFDENW